MTRNELHNRIGYHSAKVWETLCELRPALVRFDVPKIVLSPYLWRTAGQANQVERIAEFSIKFTIASKERAWYMQHIIIPHELIHHADYDLYGESEKNCGHGEKWAQLMVDYGIPADVYIPYNLCIHKNFSIKGII